jgi:NDP-sugar pyrophosphorylase family protein
MGDDQGAAFDADGRFGGTGAACAECDPPSAGTTTVLERSAATPEKVRARRDASAAEPGPAIARAHAILLAGEHSWGAGVLDGRTCRPLLQLAGRPAIVHMIEWLAARGFRSASICANSHTSAVRHCLGTGRAFNMALEYYSDVMPRGPAGCIRDAGYNVPAETFFVISGIVIPRVGIEGLFRQHQSGRAAVTAMARVVGGRSLEPVGLYAVSPWVLDQIAPTGYQDIKESLVPRLIGAGSRVLVNRVGPEAVFEITDLASYAAVNAAMLESGYGLPPGGDYVRRGEAWVHPSCAIDGSARLIGPVVLGPACSVAAEAVIVGPTSAGLGCRVERGAVVSRSILWARSSVGGRAVVDACLVCERGRVQPGRRLKGLVWTGCARHGWSRRLWKPGLPAEPPPAF